LRRLVGLVTLVEEKLQAIVDEGQVQEETVARQTISSVADNLYTTLRIIPVQASKDLVVGETIGPLHNSIGGGPGLDDLVVIL
jgi:hypothetical protein